MRRHLEMSLTLFSLSRPCIVNSCTAFKINIIFILPFKLDGVIVASSILYHANKCVPSKKRRSVASLNRSGRQTEIYQA